MLLLILFFRFYLNMNEIQILQILIKYNSQYTHYKIRISFNRASYRSRQGASIFVVVIL